MWWDIIIIWWTESWKSLSIRGATGLWTSLLHIWWSPATCLHCVVCSRFGLAAEAEGWIRWSVGSCPKIPWLLLMKTTGELEVWSASHRVDLPWRSPSLILTWQSKPQVANLLVPMGLGCSSWTQELSYANTNYEFVFVLNSPFAFKPPKPTRRNLSRGFGR